MTHASARRFVRLLTVTAAAVVSAPQAAMAQIDLGHPTLPGVLLFSIGNNAERTVAFGATSNFSIASAGIRVDPLTVSAFTLRATLRSATPGSPYPTRGAVLAQASASFTDVGLGFYDVPIAFNLLNGSFYDIAFDITAGGTNGWGFSQYNMEFYDFDAGTSPAYTVGPVRVIDGGCFAPVSCNNYQNTVMPHVRFNGNTTVVPEPGTYALLGTGLLALGIVARRRRA